MNSFFTGIIILILSGFAVSFVNRNFKILVLSLLNTIEACFCLIPAMKVLVSGKNLISSFDFNSLFGVVNFRIDYLAAFFIVIISVMSVISVIYSRGYLKSYADKNIDAHLVFFPMLVASMLAVVTCQNAIVFLICWEIMSLI